MSKLTQNSLKLMTEAPALDFQKELDAPQETNISQLTQLHPAYRPDIDGLRAIAILCVLIFHAFPSFIRGGFIGVDIFFVISGYLISFIIFRNVEANSFSFLDFYARRIRRIFPSLVLVLATVMPLGGLFYFQMSLLN